MRPHLAVALMFSSLLSLAPVAPALASEVNLPIAASWAPLDENTPTLDGSAIALDPGQPVAYLYGGRRSGFVSRQVYRQDLTASFVRWDSLSSGGGPARDKAHLWYDAPRTRLLVLGGRDSVNASQSDVWTWTETNDEWRRELDSGSGPSRIDQDEPLAYDLRRQRLLYVSKETAGTTVWSLALDGKALEWSALVTTGSPPASQFAGAAYDSSADRLLLVTPSALNAIWSLDLASGQWSEVAPGGTCPLGAGAPKVVFDAAENRLVAHVPLPSGSLPRRAYFEFDGMAGWQADPDGSRRRPDLDTAVSWAADPRRGEIHVHFGGSGLGYWAVLSSRPSLHWSSERHREGRPLAHAGTASAFDAVGRAWYVHGGTSIWPEDCHGGPVPCVSDRMLKIDLDDPRRAWEIVPEGIGPGQLQRHAMVWDGTTQRLIIVGGTDENGTLNPRVWALDLAGTPRWVEIPTDRPGPISKSLVAAFDPDRGLLWLVAGMDEEFDPYDRAQLWRLDLGPYFAVWAHMGYGFPHPIAGSVGGYDRVTGHIHYATYLACVATRVTAGTPTIKPVYHPPGIGGRGGAMFAFDEQRHGFLVHNGFYGVSNSGLHAPWNTMYWSADPIPRAIDLQAQNVMQTVLWGGLAAYDPVLDRMLILDGNVNAAGDRGYGMWELQLDHATPSRLDLVDATATGDGASIRVRFSGEGADGEVRVDRAIGAAGDDWIDVGTAIATTPGLYEFTDTDVARGATYRYRGRWLADGVEHTTAASAPITVRGGAAAVLQLRARGGILARTWPVAFDVEIAPAAGAATLELIDVAGRVVGRRSIDASGIVALSPETGGAGVYFARLRQGVDALTLRVVRL